MGAEDAYWAMSMALLAGAIVCAVMFGIVFVGALLCDLAGNIAERWWERTYRD